MSKIHDYDLNPEHAEPYLLKTGAHFARHLGVSERDVEDCAAIFREHMLTAEPWEQWKGSGYSDAFARRCAINSVHDYVSRIASVESHEAPERFLNEIALRASAQPGPESDLLHKELWSALVHAFEALSRSQKVVVNLRFETQLSFPEIGERLGVTEEAAQKRLRRSLDAMRGSLERVGFDSADALSWQEDQQ